MTLLVPVDFSDCTHGLVDRAAELSVRLGVPMTLLHIISPPPSLSGVSLGGSTAAEQLTTESESQLRFFAARAVAKGAAVVSETRSGAPEDVILSVADELEAEIIMMGTHGRRGVSRLLLGSIAEYVIRRSEVPVMTVRTQHRPECEARNCAVCATHTTAVESSLAAELEG